MKHFTKRVCALTTAALLSAALVGSQTSLFEAKAGEILFSANVEDLTDSSGNALKAWTDVWGNTINYEGDAFFYLQGDTIMFTVDAPYEGMYDFTATACQINNTGNQMQTVSVNGSEYTYYIPNGNTMEEVNMGRIRLQEGVNTIIVMGSKYGYAEYDTITVQEANFLELKGTAETCDENATAETKSLMAYLNSVYGEHILSGQQQIYGGGNSVSTTIRYDSATNTCVDSDGNTYTFDESEKDTADDGSTFVWHCYGEDGQQYTYNSQNRNYTYNDYNYDINYMKELTGLYPAIQGFDFGSYCPCYAWDDGVANRIIEWVNDKGGIATASWHINVPTTMSDYTYGESLDFSKTTYSEKTDFVTANCMVEGTAEYDYFNLCVKNLAAELQKLQDANVPLIFRPFHEAEGNGGKDGSGAWFWWSKEGYEVYNQLWIYLYDKLTEEYGLHNLIWEQNLYAWSDDSALWYTGDDYVDIVGFDKYNYQYNRHDGKTGEPNLDAESSTFWSQVGYVNNEKMVSMPENDCIPSLDNLLTEKAGWLYFCPWYDSESAHFITSDDYQNKDEVIKLYQSDYCITLDELPDDLYTSAGTTPKTTTTEAEVTTTTEATTTVSSESTTDTSLIETTTTAAVTTTEEVTTTEAKATTTTAAVTTSKSTDSEATEALYGDVNLDNAVDMTDLIVLNKIVAGTIKASEQQIANGDLDVSGGIDGIDAKYLLQFNVHIIEQLPYTD